MNDVGSMLPTRTLKITKVKEHSPAATVWVTPITQGRLAFCMSMTLSFVQALPRAALAIIAQLQPGTGPEPALSWPQDERLNVPIPMPTMIIVAAIRSA
jgi:hypothetical protein